MRANQHLVVETPRLWLLPYCPRHVPNYHHWMMSGTLRRLTSSEPLSLEEEYEAQSQWEELDDRLTFIILAKNLIGRGDREGYLCPKDVKVQCGQDEVKAMIGDVNMFLSTLDGEEFGEQAEYEGEVSVMIAEANARGHGYASEALAGLLQFTTRHLQHRLVSLVAKVSLDNEASMHLFADKLGFVERGRCEPFNQVEFVPPPLNRTFSQATESAPKTRFVDRTVQHIIRMLREKVISPHPFQWLYHEVDLGSWRKKYTESC